MPAQVSKFGENKPFTNRNVCFGDPRNKLLAAHETFVSCFKTNLFRGQMAIQWLHEMSSSEAPLGASVRVAPWLTVSPIAKAYSELKSGNYPARVLGRHPMQCFLAILNLLGHFVVLDTWLWHAFIWCFALFRRHAMLFPAELLPAGLFGVVVLDGSIGFMKGCVSNLLTRDS